MHSFAYLCHQEGRDAVRNLSLPLREAKEMAVLETFPE